MNSLRREYDFEVVQRLDEYNNIDGQGISRRCAVSMSPSSSLRPKPRPPIFRTLADSNIQAVTGTTGWLEHLPDVERAVEQSGTGLVWSPNFSVGVAVFRKLAALAAELLRDQNDYGAWAWEIHHDAKKDAPSGTLLHLVKTMEQSGYSRAASMSVPIAPESIPARTKSASIRRPIPSPCATPPAAAKDLRAAP